MIALALLVLAASILLPHEAQAASLPQEYTYAECSRADEAAMQDEMTAGSMSTSQTRSTGAAKV